MQTEKLVMPNQVEVVEGKPRKMAIVTDVAIPSDSNITKNEHEKLE